MLWPPRHTCSFMYSFSSLTRDIENNATSTYILGAGDIYSKRFAKKIGTMMYSQSIHNLDATDNYLDARTTITAFFNDQDSITMYFFHSASENGQAIDGSKITQTVVLCGTGAYGNVNSVNFKATALINGDQRYIVVDPKR